MLRVPSQHVATTCCEIFRACHKSYVANYHAFSPNITNEINSIRHKSKKNSFRQMLTKLCFHNKKCIMSKVTACCKIFDILHSTSHAAITIQLHYFIFCHLNTHNMRMCSACKKLRIRWDISWMLGMLSQHRLFVNNLTLRVEEQDAASNVMTNREFRR